MSRSVKRRKAQAKGFRSAFEQEISEAAKRAGIKLVYEDKASVIEWTPKTKKYLPDFILPNGIIVEAKGRLTVFDRAKHVAIKNQYPELDIRFVFQFDNKLMKGSKTRYSDWCEKKGFKFAFLTIPKSWAKE